jgi:glycosyltransferase involved in cell wall biosynthesis
MGAGLPLITTSVPPLGKEVSDYGAGIISEDNAKDLAGAIIQLFQNASRYEDIRLKAIQFAKHNTWRNTYDAAFRKMKK